MLKKAQIALFIFICICSISRLHAQEKEFNGMPPAQVVVSEVGSGMIAPESEFIGSVYYQEVSDVASEVNGVVEEVKFEEGQRVKKGHVLVKLSSDLLNKTLQATSASYEQVLSDLEKAKLDLKRAENLYRNELLSEQSYDEQRFTVNGLEKKSASLRADVERLEVELQKKTIKAPFGGVVIKKYVERGEWLFQGASVATIAKDDVVHIVAEVPEGIIRYIAQGMNIKVRTGLGEITGKVFAIVPRGDISTRTIPVKIRAKNILSLLEGMEAQVSLPTGEKKKTFTVNRDAVITVFGNTVVFAVIDSKAKMIPVNVVGYKNMTAGVYTEGLEEGMKVVVKGNERLRDGQAVNIINEK